MQTTSAYKQNIMPTFIQLQFRFEKEKSSGTQDSAKSLSQQILNLADLISLFCFIIAAEPSK